MVAPWTGWGRELLGSIIQYTTQLEKNSPELTRILGLLSPSLPFLLFHTPTHIVIVPMTSLINCLCLVVFVTTPTYSLETSYPQSCDPRPFPCLWMCFDHWEDYELAVSVPVVELTPQVVIGYLGIWKNDTCEAYQSPDHPRTHPLALFDPLSGMFIQPSFEDRRCENPPCLTAWRTCWMPISDRTPYPLYRDTVLAFFVREAPEFDGLHVVVTLGGLTSAHYKDLCYMYKGTMIGLTTVHGGYWVGIGDDIDSLIKFLHLPSIPSCYNRARLHIPESQICNIKTNRQRRGEPQVEWSSGILFSLGPLGNVEEPKLIRVIPKKGWGGDSQEWDDHWKESTLLHSGYAQLMREGFLNRTIPKEERKNPSRKYLPSLVVLILFCIAFYAIFLCLVPMRCPELINKLINRRRRRRGIQTFRENLAI
ncbi:putative glycoprotein 2 [Wuhan pillworm virus 2]|uniref:putative glycoprotein 2 n=1 Tax=Wuhan pillworm virus 2 TaxID=1923745 RepID=UPI00090A7AD7|nr:putative glycoprotein 2 [Wuhan pillworm virus 2]APG78804.1 putative glycoprotein 2 [Wuhan pillworm virus 2]